MTKPKPRARSLILANAFIFMLSVLLLNTGLHIADPLGIRAYYYGIADRERAILPASHGYVFRQGIYHWQNFDATITADNWRLVPDSNDGNCTIAFVGDSMTFGLGVNDADTFANQLAPNLHVRVINAGQAGYNAAQVADVIDNLDADGYVYLLYENDMEVRTTYHAAQSVYPPALYLYWQYGLLPRMGLNKRSVATDSQAFWRALERIYARDDVLVFGFQSGVLAKEVARHYPLHLIPRYNTFVSPADGHPDARGHSQIAKAMQAVVMPFTSAICSNF